MGFVSRGSTLVVALALAAFSPSAQAQEEGKTIVIGTGGTTGVYYAAGVAICNAVNKHSAEHGLRCRADSSAGSVANAEKLRAGEIQFGIVQSDVQFYAIKGFGPFRDKGPDDKLRAVMTLHPETFTLMARADAGIQGFDDLKGKRVNIGNPGSGQRTSMDLILHAKGWTKDMFAEALELTSNEQSQALCEGRIDAMVFTAGHPNASIKEAATACGAVLVDVTGPAVEGLVNTYPYLIPAVIPGNTYPGTPRNTRSFGVTATLVSSAAVPDDHVHAVVTAVFDDIVDFKFSHPAFFTLVPEDMVARGQTAPLHPGALKYYREAGDLSEQLRNIPRAQR